MSRKRQGPARWVLPEVVNPPDSVCFQIPVPNDRQHIAAFLGSIYDLAKPYKWANDDAHTAVAVGDVWFKIFEALQRNNCECPPAGGSDGDDMPRLRQDPDNPCILQQECLPGEWITLFDVSLCLTGNPGQPGPGGPGPGPGESRNDCFKLAGNGQLLLPYPVSSGDTITVSSLVGGWNDGTSSWYCPDGNGYAAGVCFAYCGHPVGDVLATACHMALVMLIDGVWYDATTGPVVIPPAVTDADVVFQCNDASLADNSGEISFCVLTQNSESPGFSHAFNFATNTGGLNSDPRSEGPGCPTAGAIYLSGTGWTDDKCPSIGATYININRTMSAREITDMAFTVTLDAAPTGSSAMQVYLVIGGVETLIQSDALTASGAHTLTVSGSWVATAIRIRIGVVSDTVNMVLGSGVVSGQGTDPF